MAPRNLQTACLSVEVGMLTMAWALTGLDRRPLK